MPFSGMRILIGCLLPLFSTGVCVLNRSFIVADLNNILVVCLACEIFLQIVSSLFLPKIVLKTNVPEDVPLLSEPVPCLTIALRWHC